MDYEQIKIITKRILVKGMVQGVGFRPLVYHCAKQHGVKGFVRNTGGIVEIIAQAPEKNIVEFIDDLKLEKKGSARVTDLLIEDIEKLEFSEFTIESSKDEVDTPVITPDLALCSRCREDLLNPLNRRYLNPFVSCVDCGPRFTIQSAMPYDRNNTAMDEFPMCISCGEEYTSPNDRRYHAQTISCHDCGPYLTFGNLSREKAFEEAVHILKAGGIIAVKGIGGFQFTCSPFLEETVKKLRKLKGREEKPFAVMFETMDEIYYYCEVSIKEEELLESSAKPIVLLIRKGGEMARSVNGESAYLGAFLPYTPLQVMLLKACGPLVMTSANLSGSPIIYKEEDFKQIDSPYLDGVLSHNREILRPVDDSVVKIVNQEPQLIRRSRGYTPYPIALPGARQKISLLSAGGDLKAAFCLYKSGNAVISPYFGDLENSNVMEAYKKSISDLSHLLQIQPEEVICDFHPGYYSTQYVKSLGLPITQVQHHHAHIASVMAEHGLREKVIGVAFDGTGMGMDGTIWGGEFLLCEENRFAREAHLKAVPLVGGDSIMKNARNTAQCYLMNYGIDELAHDENNELLRAALNHNINTIPSSGMGRLFDVVASLLGIRQYNHYEGECAAMLEKAALIALRQRSSPVEMRFSIQPGKDGWEVDARSVIETILTGLSSRDHNSLALGFHYAVADMIKEVCSIIRQEQNCSRVVLSGGVFQNTILMERTVALLRKEQFEVYYNRVVPPNDGCISLGQTWIGLMR